MALYKLLKNLEGEEIGVTRQFSGYEKDIPFADDNVDYQEYLEWKSAGNTPDAADKYDPWEKVRFDRDQLLKNSDWTMTTGATVDQAQWAAYREKLRDLPQRYSSYSDVVWPTPPSTKGPNTK